MIEISSKKLKGPKNVYKITHDWMLGDSDGDTTTTQFVPKDNPHLDKFLECCDRLTEEQPGTWANILDTKTIRKILKNDYEFFKRFLEGAKNQTQEEQELTFEVMTESGMTFVTYQGFSIEYFDENGTKFRCKWTKNKEE